MLKRKKVLPIAAVAIVAILAIGLLVIFASDESVAEGKIVGGGHTRAVSYNNALQPAPGTQLFTMDIENDKLVTGPETIHSVVGGAFKLDVTIHTTAPEYEFYVDHYADNSEIDYTPDGKKDVLVGQVYVFTDKSGSFKYGIENEATHSKHQLGTLIVN